MRIKCVVINERSLRPQRVDIDGIGVTDPSITMLTAGTVVPFDLSFNNPTEDLMLHK